MEQNEKQVQEQTFPDEKKVKKSKVQSYLGTFTLMVFGLAIIFSYVYQSTKQVYLNYEIVNRNKDINNLNIELMEAKVENEKLQTNENIERVASEKLGMAYNESDKIIVIKEVLTTNEAIVDGDKTKIKIFMSSLYEEANNQLSQLSLESMARYFEFK